MDGYNIQKETEVTLKIWTVKTVVGPDHQIAFKVPEDIPEGPLELVIVAQPVLYGTDINEKEWLRSASANPAFDFLKEAQENIYSQNDGRPFNIIR